MTADRHERPGELPYDLVVAADLDRGIARAGHIPWRLSADLRHFKRLTATTTAAGAQNAVVMGRVTWASLPAQVQPLPGRVNVVLSRAAALDLPSGVMHACDLADALARLRERTPAIERVFVIGGAQVYAAALRAPGCRYIYYTRVQGHFGCDTFFPAFEHDHRLIEILDQDQGPTGNAGPARALARDAVSPGASTEAENRPPGYRIEVWGRIR
ncbi:dihydrofolate reductase [Haliangium sp.]|uniref:dihydrofolate reductase n=1 Tax=Haliangium sp. TaxID=2663208 RepID=UPI003D12048C